MTATTKHKHAPSARTEDLPDATGTLLMLDPTTLLLDGNVRGSVDLDKDFIASIREQGVLVPIVAVRTAEGTHRVRYGQRRTLAAIEAGRSAVPVYICGEETSTDQAAITRIVTQVHENELRAGLSTADKAAAVEQLSLLGLSASNIAKQIKGNRSDVDHALTVAASKLATASTQRYDFLTLDMAAAVADFETEPETVKALIAAAKQGEGQFAHVAQRARDDRARALARTAVEQQLTEHGIRIIDPAGRASTKQLTELIDAATGEQLTADGHQSCPGHAAYISQDYWRSTPEPTYVCTDWKTHGHRDRYRADKVPAAQLSEDQRDKARAERRAVIDNNKAWVSAETVRRSWLTNFLSRKTPPKGAATFLATELAHGSHELGQALAYNGNPLLHELLGLKNKDALADSAPTATDARAQVLALAFVLAAYEAQTSKQTWRHADPDKGRYFAYLAANGYELSDVEQLCLPKTTNRRRRPAVEDSAA